MKETARSSRENIVDGGSFVSVAGVVPVNVFVEGGINTVSGDESPDFIPSLCLLLKTNLLNFSSIASLSTVPSSPNTNCC